LKPLALKKKLTIAIAALLLAIALPLYPAFSGSPPSLGPNDYSQNPAPFTLPFHLVDGYILVDGQVNDTVGRFLFDTATPWGFFLNHAHVPLGKDTFLQMGHAGSGQEMPLYRQDTPIAAIALADQIAFQNLEGMIHTDWSFTAANLGTDFLGSVGHEFHRNYLYTIDYDRQLIQFYPFDQAEALLADYEAAGRLVAQIKSIDTEDMLKPRFDLTLGTETLHGFWDTGNLGSLELTASAKVALEAAGLLTLEAGEFVYGVRESSTRANIIGLRLGDQPLADLRNLTFTLGDDNELGMGYQFLKHYITLWNYQDQTFALIRPSAQPRGTARTL
jgi:hypothetical protein